MVMMSAVRLREERQVFLSDYLRAANKAPVALSTPFSETPKVQAEWQAALNALEAIGGGKLLLPAGQIAIDAPIITIPSNVTIRGLPWLTKVLIGNGYAGNGSVFENKTITSDGSLANPGIKIIDVWFDGANRNFPLWLSKLDGTPITDPEADYRVGGCLAPTTFANITLGVSGGAVTSVTINSGGSGYVYPPTLWVTGDGYGAFINLTISGGAVTGYFIVRGGTGYTTATAEVAGGGANPVTALFAANRRNPNWNHQGLLLSFAKVQSPVVRGCRFTNYGGMVIGDLGCDSRVVEDNDFENCGSIDSEAQLIWSAYYGDYATKPANFRHTTNGVFRRNRIKNCKRSVATIGDIDGDYSHNTIDGWGEGCFFFVESVKRPTVSHNKAKNGRITDIVCRFVEANDDANIFDNDISECDGAAITTIGNGSLISRNTVTAPTAFTSVLPFGPYSERVGYGQGSAANAGKPISIEERACFMVVTASSDPAAAPKASRILGNTILANDNGNAYLFVVAFSKGAANAIGPVLIEGNDITQSPSTALFDVVSADACLDKNKPFRCVNNPGHVSMGAVFKHDTIPSGTSGLRKYTFGFRPRLVLINARASVSSIAHTVGVFADEEARNPGTTGASNTTGGLLRFAATNAPAVDQGSDNIGGLLIRTTAGAVLTSTAIGFSSDGWSMSINSPTTADCILEVIGIP